MSTPYAKAKDTLRAEFDRRAGTQEPLSTQLRDRLLRELDRDETAQHRTGNRLTCCLPPRERINPDSLHSFTFGT